MYNTYIVHLLNAVVSLSRQAHIGRLCVYDHQNRIGAITSHQVIDGYVILVQFGACIYNDMSHITHWKLYS